MANENFYSVIPEIRNRGSHLLFKKKDLDSRERHSGMTNWLVLFFFFSCPYLYSQTKKVNVPVVETAADGTRTLILPDDIETALQSESPGYRIPKDSEYNSEMLGYYNSRLIGVHPSVAWGDFNGDTKRDYAFLVITQEGKLGPLVELLIFNGHKKNGGTFDINRQGEVYNFKDDYVSFVDAKLTKGRYKRNGWYINWDKKKNSYVTLKP
ncbi:MAG: hypothetical protein ACKVQC_01750 [Elusimicrobiota bacterium]